MLTGFSDRRTALRFESLMHLHRVTDVREWLDVAHAIVEKYAEEFWWGFCDVRVNGVGASDYVWGGNGFLALDLGVGHVRRTSEKNLCV